MALIGTTRPLERLALIALVHEAMDKGDRMELRAEELRLLLEPAPNNPLLVTREEVASAAQFAATHGATMTLSWQQLATLLEQPPVPLRLTCPDCGELHLDEGEWATRVHHSHSCQSCGLTWRPAVVPTVGVRFLPGFKNGPKE